MKFNNSIFFKVALVAALCMGMSSCEDYLDKEPESTVSESEAFKNFKNFQGYIEEIYNCIPDKEKCNWCPSWNWGDDEIFNTAADFQMTHQVDLGNFRYWTSNDNWLFRGNNPRSKSPMDHSLWPHMWYCIRKANMGIDNLDNIVSATKEERQLLEGQLYFFRAWWHFEMMQYVGGLPYVDRTLDANTIEDLRLPRLSPEECALKAVEDFKHAADVLPVDWEKTAPGKLTPGKNILRINKIMALGYAGKALLWASSPLVKNGAQTGALANGKTYDYNVDLAKQAAEAFGEVLALVEAGQTQYKFADFDYTNIYDHEATNKGTSYSDIFCTTKQNWKMPGTTEAIFRGPSGDGGNANASNWNNSKVWGPKVGGIVEHDNVIHHPTAELVEMYGMENGLPITDPQSGFDPTHPFLNRDPRFYHDIVFDGFKYINNTLDPEQEYMRYCTLYTGGFMRDDASGSRTGYYIQKLIPHQANKFDKAYDWGDALHCYLPYMRLADIYLMYAEACAAAQGSSYKASNCPLTGRDAINAVRKRCGAGVVADKYAADQKLFMDEVRRERAVELSFEGFRFNDLQRWLLLSEPGYTTKSSHEFTRVETDAFYSAVDKETGLNVNDPRTAEVKGFTKKPILTREFTAKHYWFPLPIDQTYIYAEFNQNPGW